MVDEYIRQLSDLGISLHSLKLLGDFEIPEEDRKLTERELIEKILTDSSYKEQKKTIERYISEFVRADLITQATHLRRGKDLVNPYNDNLIDGGVYIYRTPEKDKDGKMVQTGEGEYIKEVDQEKYVQMTYIAPEKFQELVNSNSPKLRYKYTIDENGYIEVAKMKTVVTKTKSSSEIFGSTDKTTTVEDILHIDYKQYIEKYTMPYEFLINLCMITQNPEFVYHVAMLARQTEIILVVQDDTTIVDEIRTEVRKIQSFKNTSSSSREGAEVTEESTETFVTETITTEMTPHLEIKQANTWSFYEKFEYTKTVKVEGPNTQGPVSGPCNVQDTLPNYYPGTPETITLPDGTTKTVTTGEYWTGGPWIVENKVTTSTTITTTKYNPGLLANSIEKSKQFLGLLRNDTGKCVERNCYKNHKKVKKCAKLAEFNLDGKNVQYIIPNSTNLDAPLNRLKSGERELYELLGDNLHGDSENEETNEMYSEYKTRMTGVVEHLKYLMSFPPNEDIDYSKEDPDYEQDPDYDEPIDDDEINVDDLIVKTDEEGALPPVTKEQLIGIINSMYNGKRKSNATSIVNTLIDCQENYNVNALFVLAFADQESNIGTANTKWVRQNNWLSWNLGQEFSSPQDNVETVMRNIANGGNYFRQGKITIKDIGLTYCPNDPPDYPHQGDDWVINVTNKVKRMYRMLGIDLGDTGGGSSGAGDGNDVRGTYTVDGRTYKEYKQDSGSSWEQNSFAGKTMKSSGCSITSVAIILTGYGQDVTPEDIRKEVGGKITNLVTLLQKHGVSCNRPGRALTAEQIRTHMQTGKPIIVNVKGEWTSSTGHYMTLLDYRNNNGREEVYVSNPGTVNSSKNGWVALSRITNNMKTQSILITQD